MDYRIGFPLSRPSADFKHAVLVLYPCEQTGFAEVLYENQRYRIPQHNLGSQILSPLVKQGCYGQLLLSGEQERDVIDHRANEVIVQGRSMQLALIMSVYAKNVSGHDHLPLVLMSAAVKYPLGAPPFLSAEVEPYCQPEESRLSILDKYLAAQEVNAAYLILCEQDVDALENVMQEKGEVLPKASLSDLEKPLTEVYHPKVVCLKREEVPNLAKVLGIDPLHYRDNKSTKSKNHSKGPLLALVSCVFAIVFAIVIYFLYTHIQMEKQISEWNQRRQYLIAEIFGDKYKAKKSRVRDEALKEFIQLERKLLKIKKGKGVEIDDERIDLKEVDLRMSDLHKQDLGMTNLLKANFQAANLNRVSFKGAYLKGAIFLNTHLYSTNFQYAILHNANFKGANLRGADFSHSIGLDNAELNSAVYDEKTIWPDHFSVDLLKKKGLLYRPVDAKPVFINPLKESQENKDNLRKD